METRLPAESMLGKKEPWHEHEAGVTCSPHLESSKWFTCFGTKKYLKVLCWLFMTHFILRCPHPRWIDPLKYFMHLAVIVPKITVSHHCITSHRRLCSTCWSFNGPLQNTTSHFHTNTAAGVKEAVPAGRQFTTWNRLWGMCAQLEVML